MLKYLFARVANINSGRKRRFMIRGMVTEGNVSEVSVLKAVLTHPNVVL